MLFGNPVAATIPFSSTTKACGVAVDRNAHETIPSSWKTISRSGSSERASRSCSSRTMT
jgi:hypothetical protein